MDTAQQLADAVARELFGAEEDPSLVIPFVALALIACPTLADASQEQCQYIYDRLIGCLAARLVARDAVKTKLYLN
jgi:hypothetical protein